MQVLEGNTYLLVYSARTVGRVVCTYVIGFYEIVLCEMWITCTFCHGFWFVYIFFSVGWFFSINKVWFQESSFKQEIAYVTQLCMCVYVCHSSKISGLCSTKCSSEMLQNLLYFMYKKTHVVFFVFHFMQLYIFTLWMPWSMST